MAGGGRKKASFKGDHSFQQNTCFLMWEASFKGDHSLIGGPGFSRVVDGNDPECFEAGLINYGGNYVKYKV